MKLENSIALPRLPTTPGNGDDADITPKDIANGLKALRQQGLPQIRHALSPRLELRLSQLLAQAEALCVSDLEFELGVDGLCFVNGKPIPHSGKGLAMVWLILASIQLREPALRPEWFCPGKRSTGSALQALKRAADDAERVSERLAYVIRSIGVERGVLVLKRNPLLRVNCKLSPDLAEVFRRVA